MKMTGFLKATLLLAAAMACCLNAAAQSQACDDAACSPFGWATCSDAEGTPYRLDGGWRNGNPSCVVLYASGHDDRAAIQYAISKFDIVILDGTDGDFTISSTMKLDSCRNKTIVGRNGARLCTEWFISPEMKQLLTDANLTQYSGTSGTGGTLSNGKEISEEQELKTRQLIIDAYGDEKESYRNSGIFLLNANCENIILRNLTLIGPGCVDVGGADLISNNGATHVWVDHCELVDGMDGSLDSGHNPADMFVTYSWNHFRYTDRSYSHALPCGTMWGQGFCQYVTYSHCHWGEGCLGRLPQLGNTTAHLFNNYYSCIGNSRCVYLLEDDRLLMENCYAATGVKRPFGFAAVDDIAYVTRGNVGFGSYNDAVSGSQPIEVPYPYTLLPADDVPAALTDEHGAGATLSESMLFPEPIEGLEQASWEIYAIRQGEAMESGSRIAYSHITLTVGEAGGAPFDAARSASIADMPFVAFTPGNGLDGQKPGGTFYLFQPDCDGWLTVGVRQNANKKLYITEDGVVLPTFDGIVQEEVYNGTYSLPVLAGKTYKLYCAASKLGFYGFIFEYQPGATPVRDAFIPSLPDASRQSALPHSYTLDGRRLPAVPVSPGIYIVNGKKVVGR